MRFCPFCAQENSDDVSECAHCGRKLPNVAAPIASTTRSIPAVPPRRAPRPFPRARPVTPAPPTRVDPPVFGPPALGFPVHEPVEEAIPRPVSETASRARSGTLLGIPAQKRLDSQHLDRDAATRVESAPVERALPSDDDLTTSSAESTVPTPRYDDPAESSATHTVPDLRPRLSSEAKFNAPDRTDAQLRAPPLHGPASTPRVRPPGDGLAPPLPLPPLPVAKQAPLRGDAILSSSRTAPGPVMGLDSQAIDSGRDLVQLPDSGPIELPTRATRMPTQSRLEPAPAEVDFGLAPMPAHPPAKIWPSVQYLVPLGRAVWARHRAKKTLSGLLHDDQRRVDHALRDLGEAAWKLTPRPAELKPDLDRADADEEKRRLAEQELARLAAAIEAERTRWADEEQTRQRELGKHETEVSRLTTELAAQRRVQKAEEQKLRELEHRVRAAERTMQQHLSRAAKAESKPVGKGGGPAAAEAARALADVARADIDGYTPELEAQHQVVRAHDAPIAELDRFLTDEHQQVAVHEAGLDTARGASAQTLAGLEVACEQQDTMRLAAERSVRLRLIATGTLLSLHRMNHTQSDGAFSPLYKTLDERQTVAAGHERRIAELDDERQGYDRAALQRGLIAVGGTLGLLAILAMVLSLLLARH